MFELGVETASLVNLCFGGLSIYLAHALYRSPRKWWQCVLAWLSVLVVSTVGGLILDPLFPALTHERIQTFLGLDAILVYLYLFPNIPPAQRMFTYFLVDNIIYLLILLARIVAMLVWQVTALSVDILFLVCFLLFAAGALTVFHLRLKKVILSALPHFRQHLGALTAFSAICYLATLLIANAWDPWEPMTLAFTLSNVALAALAISGYALSFRTLSMAHARNAEEEHTRHLTEQLVLAERYYGGMVEQIQQTRIRTHDLRHHITAISALCEGGQWERLRAYVSALVREMPKGLPRRYCGVDELNAMLDYYDNQCRQAGIPFTCRVGLPAQTGVAPLHLCVIFGNALENALEASQQVPEGMRFVTLTAVCTQGRIAISVSNRFAGSLSMGMGGALLSTKIEPGHGLGLASIGETAQRYDGWCGTKTEGDVFTLQVTLSKAE